MSLVALLLAVTAAIPPALRDLEVAAGRIYEQAGDPAQVQASLDRAAADLEKLSRDPAVASARLGEALLAVRAAAEQGDERALKHHAAELMARVADVRSQREPLATAGLSQLEASLRAIELHASAEDGADLARAACALWARIAQERTYSGSPAASALHTEMSAISRAVKTGNDDLLSGSLARARELIADLRAEARQR